MKNRGQRKVIIGEVISDRMEKTRVVCTQRLVKHKNYKRYIRKSSKFYAHDEMGISKIGDKVRIVESRPLSKTKRWRVVEVLEEGRHDSARVGA